MQEQTTYNYKVVGQFAIKTVVWGIGGMTGRLRPLHDSDRRVGQC